MNWVIVIHRVDDLEAWQRIFDEAAPLRRAAGEREYRVMCSQDDRNEVVHLARWSSLQEARAFFESPEVVAIRARAGVHPPRFLYLDELAAGEL